LTLLERENDRYVPSKCLTDPSRSNIGIDAKELIQTLRLLDPLSLPVSKGRETDDGTRRTAQLVVVGMDVVSMQSCDADGREREGGGELLDGDFET
jgi:hypothetical protein